MSCRPTVPQATRSYVVRRLDDADQELTLLKKARGYDCLDKVSDLLSIHSCAFDIDISTPFGIIIKSTRRIMDKIFACVAANTRRKQGLRLFHVLITKCIFPQVCKSLGLLEREYFGLRYQDKAGDWLWVNLRNPLSEQVPQGNRVVIEMRVKYFISPHKILQPVTRYAMTSNISSIIMQLYSSTKPSPSP